VVTGFSLISAAAGQPEGVRGGWRRLGRLAIAITPAWLVAGVFLASYLVNPPLKGPVAPAEAVRRSASRLWFENVIPSVAGGPWQWRDDIVGLPSVQTTHTVATAGWIVAAVLLAVALVAVALRRGWGALGDALGGWVLLTLQLAIGLILVARYRLGFVGDVLFTHPHYGSDAVLTLAMALGLTAVGIRHREQRERLPHAPVSWREVGAAALIIGVFVSATASAGRFGDLASRMTPKPYFENLVRSARADPTKARLLDEHLPAHAMPTLFFPRNTLSYMLPAIPGAPKIVPAVSALHVVAPDGTIVDADVPPGVESAVLAKRGPLCATGPAPVVVPLDADMFGWVWVAKIEYDLDAATDVTVHLGPELQSTFPLERGEDTVFVAAPLGQGPLLEITPNEPGARLCVRHVVVGIAEPLEPFTSAGPDLSGG
jgi:hypothetical protein